jgi:hypothetical protein
MYLYPNTTGLKSGVVMSTILQQTGSWIGGVQKNAKLYVQIPFMGANLVF